MFECIFLSTDPPEVEVAEAMREYHPKLKQRHLSVSCNVTADPSPDVNWQRGRLVLSTHDTKVRGVTQHTALLHNPLCFISE